VASFPAQAGNHHFARAHSERSVELELIPQGTLAERLHAAGAGLGGFFTPTGVGSELASGKEMRTIAGREYLFESPLRGDFALIRAHVGDRMGNLRYRLSARNFNPVMAMAAEVTVAEVQRIVTVGEIDPDDVHTPSVFVDRVVEAPR
jgi:3-oxoadipate CoA-transferase, alpha subunit